MKPSTRLFSSKAWLKRHTSDVYVKQAVEKDLRSRSHFKLIEIQDKYKIIRSDSVVIDLGAAPGGWSIAASNIVNPDKGLIVAVDLLDIKPIKNVTIVKGDFTDEKCQDEILSSCEDRKVDVVLSDMLQNVSGQHDLDHYRSLDLCRTALNFTKTILSQQGSFLCKYLRGSGEKDFINEVKTVFKDVHIIKPKASRGESSEMYLLGRHRLF